MPKPAFLPDPPISYTHEPVRISFELPWEYGVILDVLNFYRTGRVGDRSEYVAGLIRDRLAETACDLWTVGHIYLPRAVLRCAAAEAEDFTGIVPTDDQVQHFMDLFDECVGPDLDAPAAVCPTIHYQWLPGSASLPSSNHRKRRR